MSAPRTLWIDLETTGLSPRRNCIVQLGLHSELRTEEVLVCDPRLIDESCRAAFVDEGALRVNGIDLGDVLEHGVSLGRALELLEAHVAELAGEGGDLVFWGGHNFGSFDLQFLLVAAARAGRKLPRHAHRYYDSAAAILMMADAGLIPPGLSLGQAAEALDIDATDHHRAGADARLAALVWQAAVSRLGGVCLAVEGNAAQALADHLTAPRPERGGFFVLNRPIVPKAEDQEVG